MVMPAANGDQVAIAILAKAPVPGLAKTRLIPSIGAHAAAVLQERLTERTIVTALAANIGPVTVWCTPDTSHGTFRELATRYKIKLKRQPDGDLGQRMLAAILANDGPTLVIGSDCPAFTPECLNAGARALHDGADVVLTAAEDGGYVLIGMRIKQSQLFTNVSWGTTKVLAETRARVNALRLVSVELPPLWDVDTEDDVARMEHAYPELSLKSH
jgi:rSAM/selenodomain-associated transferase 1